MFTTNRLGYPPVISSYFTDTILDPQKKAVDGWLTHTNPIAF